MYIAEHSYAIIIILMWNTYNMYIVGGSVLVDVMVDICGCL